MCLQRSEFRSVLTNFKFHNISAVIIDERQFTASQNDDQKDNLLDWDKTTSVQG